MRILETDLPDLKKIERQHQLISKIARMMNCSRGQAFVSIVMEILSAREPRRTDEWIYASAHRMWIEFGRKGRELPEFILDRCLDIVNQTRKPPSINREVVDGLHPPRIRMKKNRAKPRRK